jgi:hypothetical protein
MTTQRGIYNFEYRIIPTAYGEIKMAVGRAAIPTNDIITLVPVQAVA